MPCQTPCRNCDRRGLPILFTRYAAAYSAQEPEMNALRTLRPAGNFDATPSNEDIKTAVYNVRMLRPGYLYVRYVHPRYPLPVWQGYEVHPHGYLGQFDVEFPQNARSQPACEMEIRGANMSLVWVEDAKNIKEFHYFFHPTPIDPAHLMQEIEPKRDKYMHKLDVPALVGGGAGQPHTCSSGELKAQVVEFAALDNEPLRNAIAPQWYGLMGANAIERGWGDWEETVEIPDTVPPNTTMLTTAELAAPTTAHVYLRKGPSYADAHGKRLRKMAEYLQKHKGAVVACHDPIGIAQELGHLQAEAQSTYTRWQKQPAPGLHASVSNEWAFQCAMGGREIFGLARASATGKVDKSYAAASQRNAALYPDPPDLPEKEKLWRQKSRKDAWDKARNDANQGVVKNYMKYFDEADAKERIAAQDKQMKACEDLKATLWSDQLAWLLSPALEVAIGRYTDKDSHIGRPGGGAALSVELAECLAGSEHNRAGRTWLCTQSMSSGKGVLARVLSFSNQTLQETLRKLEAAQPAAPPNPKAEPTTAQADSLADLLKPLAGYMGLGDKALGYIQAATASNAPALARKTAWAGHVASFVNLQMMDRLGKLPAGQVEAAAMKFVALTGLVTLGSNSAKYAGDLSQVAKEQAHQASQQVVKAGHAADTRTRAPNVRAAALAAAFDVAQALVKGRQLQVKGDPRTVSEMAGNLLQAIGSLVDMRAKAYEETIYAAVREAEYFKALPVGEKVNEMQLLKLRKLAFNFLLPAAMVSAFWDGKDAWTSYQRGADGLMTAQIAGIAGTVFAIASTGLAAFGYGSAALAAGLGLVGATLTILSILFVLALKEEEWINWLTDNPMNKERKNKKPIHDNLQDTLQKLVNVKATLKPA